MKIEVEIMDLNCLTTQEKLCYLYCYYVFNIGIYPTIRLCNENLSELKDWASVCQQLVLKGYLAHGSKQEWLIPMI